MRTCNFTLVDLVIHMVFSSFHIVILACVDAAVPDVEAKETTKAICKPVTMTYLVIV